jgi:hypothetical protein
MGKFANYDVRQWLDGVLSQHPESHASETEARPRSGSVSNFASMVLAASIAILPGLSAGEVTHQPNTSLRSPNSIARGGDPDSVYWFEAAPTPLVAADSAVERFESYFKEIHAQLQVGGLRDVPSETRVAARLALSRTAPDDWIVRLASDLGKLTD